MRKISRVLLYLWLSLSFSAAGADTTASWLELPNGAKQAAFAGSLGSIADDLDALGVNPAGLAYLSGTEISALHNQWAQGLSVEHLAFGHGFGEFGLAVGGDYVNFGQVPLFDLSALGTPVANGTFSPMGMVLYAGAGKEVLPGMSLGAGAKILFQSLVSGVTSSAEALDLGIQYRNKPSGFSCGLALLNSGTALEGADLPMELHLSGAYQAQVVIGQEFSIGTDLALGLKDNSHYTVGLGAEYTYQGLVALRAGYRLAPYGQLQGLAGLTAGVGVRLGPLDLSYAMTTLGDLGTGHQVSLGYLLETGSRRPPSEPTGLVTGWEEGKITLSWDDVREMGVLGYNFYLKKGKDKDFKKVNPKPLEENTLYLGRLKKGATYLLGVTTVGRDGSESPMAQLTFTP